MYMLPDKVYLRDIERFDILPLVLTYSTYKIVPYLYIVITLL